jgi:hypothetical protein
MLNKNRPVDNEEQHKKRNKLLIKTRMRNEKLAYLACT